MLEVKNIYKKFKNYQALVDISLDVRAGELVALLGPSGSGKTTLLRIIAGLEFADAGSILFDREEADTKHISERNVGFVFQHYALFKHLTVKENIAFGLKVRRDFADWKQDQIDERVASLLELIHLEQLADRYPMQLSGGQRQRVALARALAVEPQVLLLDEPFGALDAKVRKELRRWIRRLHDKIHLTSLFVTHDQEEAMEVADRIVIMNHGRIEQVGSPEEVYEHPANPFVYDFLGSYNRFERWNDQQGILTTVFARPYDMRLEFKPSRSDSIEVKIVHINPTGALVKLEMERSDHSLILAELSKDAFTNLSLKKGDLVYAYPVKFQTFEGATP